ncbi:uncharacterized protein LOC128716206 [Anopheles marshallii]|nr:uncharacterized protein LOC128716206 [Anopheles marshallii]
MLDPLNVPAIIDRLEESFGRPEVVYREMVKEVLKVRIENPYKIPELADAIDNLVMNVTALNCTNYLNDPRLIDDVMARMPISYQLEWIDYTSELRTGEHTTLNELNDWLKLLARKIRRVVKGSGRDHLLLHEDDFKQQDQRSLQPTNEKKGFTCPECGNNHSVIQCEAFKGKTIADKWATVKAAKLCHGCLRFSNHQIKDLINRNKPEPKPRIVFDAASKIEGVSLNSQLLPGPDALTSLFGILIRFREGKIAVAGDIKEMFHQVKVRPEDQQAQCVLWRGCNEEKPPEIYTMQVMTFGATCSPACAQAVKNENARRCKQSHPKAYKAILNQHYVDDYIDSFSTEIEAKETTKQVITVHDQASFFIRNFISNSECLLSAIPSERRQSGESVVFFEEKHGTYDKILGVHWNIVSDCLGYNIKYDNVRTDLLSKQNPTKREVLSFVMSIYDPLGLLSYITIQGRILLRSLHRAMTDWDERIPEDLGVKWREWLILVKEANRFEVSRCVIPAKTQSIELHTFVDASEEAFAACVYLRSFNGQKYTTHLLAAKARVAPLKNLSIPRLELQAAVLGVRLTHLVKQELRVTIEKTTYWSDSQTVLGWIVNRKRKYHQFVAHRVSEILETSAMDQWRWVPTKENPADRATKITATDDVWKHGPSFLLQQETMWPQARIKPTAEEERVMHHFEERKLLNEDYYSDWRKLVRHGVILRKFVHYLKDKTRFSPTTRTSDVAAVKAMMYIRAQRECFPAEYSALEKETPVSKQSILNKLVPFLDDRGIMRSRSRLENLEVIPPGTRCPIIIPQKHRITKLLVRDYHEQSLHQADNVVIGNLRQEFWIINVRAVLNNVKRCCQWCILHACKPAPPLMAPLPEFRANPYTSPFLHTGVDYFGPFEVAIRRSTEKRWGVIFICMSTRAVHLELAKKLDTDSFLVCLKNFQHRRGKIGHLYSDNGTNFIGADRELSNLVADINDRMGKEAAIQYNIEWHFNPPSAPHFGGIWERQIQTIKKGLRQMMDEWRLRKPSPETLVATLIEIEFILNSRPLTHIPVTNDEEEILTPFHFLIGRSGSAVPPLSLMTSSIDVKQYKQVQHHSKVFWDKWKREYLPTLLKRDKWTNKVEPLKEDDLVVLTDDNATPGKWLKGRITKVYRAADDQVRSVEVRTVNGVLKRPVVKVALVNVRQKEHILNVNGKRRNEIGGRNDVAKMKRNQE